MVETVTRIRILGTDGSKINQALAMWALVAANKTPASIPGTEINYVVIKPVDTEPMPVLIDKNKYKGKCKKLRREARGW